MQSASATFACQKCGKSYDWQPEYVGRVAKCPCGAVVKVPSAPVGSEQEKQDPNPGYLVEPPPNPGNSNIPTAEASILNMHAPVAASASSPRFRAPMEVPDEDLHPDVEKELNELAEYGEQEGAQPNPYLDFTLPMILLGIGLVLAIGDAFVQTRGGLSFIAAIIGVIIATVINVILIVIGLLVAAKIAGINFGPVGTAILKMAAIYLAPTTLGNLVTQVLGGDMAVTILGNAVSIVLYWGLLSYLFKLDGQQTMICVFCIGLLRLLAAMLVVGAVLAAMGSGMGAADLDAIEDADEAVHMLNEQD